MTCGYAHVIADAIPLALRNRFSGNRHLVAALYFCAVTILFAVATLLYYLQITSIYGAYLFAFALLGLRWPLELLAVFMFLLSLKHREFTHMSMIFGDAELYITEWVIAISTIAALPGIRRIWHTYRLPCLLIAIFLGVGTLLLLLTAPYWGFMNAMRDFAIVYYSLFAILVFAHAGTLRRITLLFAALLLGTLPNLLAEIMNFFYGTLPTTYYQKNYSMRNSFYYLVVFGLCLPFLRYHEKRIRQLAITYCSAVFLVTVLYSYTTTAMLILVLLALIYVLPRIRELNRALLFGIILLFAVPLSFSSNQKAHQFRDIFSQKTYMENSRLPLDIAALRDFTEYPYGIGFGTPIFGLHAQNIIIDFNAFHSLHNSHLTLLRRTGFIGFGLYLLILIFVLFRGVKHYYAVRAVTFEKTLTLGGIYALLCVIFFSMAHVALEGPFFGAVHWILIASLYCLSVTHGEKTV